MLHTSRHACVVVGVVVQVFGAVCIEQCDACSGDGAHFRTGGGGNDGSRVCNRIRRRGLECGPGTIMNLRRLAWAICSAVRRVPSGFASLL